MHIAVAGGTGSIGRLAVEAVRQSGDTPIVLARSTGVDLMTGAGLDEALVDADVVIDVTNRETISRKKAVHFFGTVTRTLQDAEVRLGISHHIVLSIVGASDIDWGYYLGKRRQEELALAGPVPATVLRATQFHEFATQMIDRGGPVVLVPKMLSQPIAAREVAAALVEAAREKPAGIAPELAGPEELFMPDMVRRLLRTRNSRRPTLALRLPGAAGRAMATGGLLPSTPGPRGRQTFDQWLADAEPGLTHEQ
jgi:uncharacterized protein YbjT (DUF2867 family)